MSVCVGTGINSLGELPPFLVLHLSLNAHRVHQAGIDVCSTLTFVAGRKSMEDFNFSLQTKSDKHFEPK